MTVIIDGKLVAEAVKAEVKAAVSKLAQAGCVPGLATVLVGEDPASQVYIKNKVRSCEACGILSLHHSVEASISQAALLELIKTLNDDKRVHGILVQLPLPASIKAEAILEAIDPAKDVDGFHPYNVGRLTAGQKSLEPCTPAGMMRLLAHYKISVAGKKAVVLGRSNIVGKPIALMLLKADATVTIAHPKTPDLPELVRGADIVVAAIGRPKFVPGDWIKPGATVLDVGINRLPEGGLCGDVDFATASLRAGAITPVPGGVGPMTIAMLLANTVSAAQASLL